MLNRDLPICMLLAVLDWDKVVSYFKSLPASGDRVKYLELGKTPEGRLLIAVVIGSCVSTIPRRKRRTSPLHHIR